MRLPSVYSKTYHFTEYLFKTTVNLKKSLRPSLGRKMEEQALLLLTTLRKSLLTPGDSPHLDHLLAGIDDLGVYIHLTYELKGFSHHEYSQLSEDLETMAKMLGAMKKASKKQKRLSTNK